MSENTFIFLLIPNFLCTFLIGNMYTANMVVEDQFPSLVSKVRILVASWMFVLIFVLSSAMAEKMKRQSHNFNGFESWLSWMFMPAFVIISLM